MYNQITLVQYRCFPIPNPRNVDSISVFDNKIQLRTAGNFAVCFRVVKNVLSRLNQLQNTCRILKRMSVAQRIYIFFDLFQNRYLESYCSDLFLGKLRESSETLTRRAKSSIICGPSKRPPEYCSDGSKQPKTFFVFKNSKNWLSLEHFRGSKFVLGLDIAVTYYANAILLRLACSVFVCALHRRHIRDSADQSIAACDDDNHHNHNSMEVRDSPAHRP